MARYEVKMVKVRAYYKTIEVEAEDEFGARNIACDLADDENADWEDNGCIDDDDWEFVCAEEISD